MKIFKPLSIVFFLLFLIGVIAGIKFRVSLPLTTCWGFLGAWLFGFIYANFKNEETEDLTILDSPEKQ